MSEVYVCVCVCVCVCVTDSLYYYLLWQVVSCAASRCRRIVKAAVARRPTPHAFVLKGLQQ